MTTRLIGGPALRFQPDGRLVSLVRAGYESAFEEIFRRYAAALRSYAASIVTAQRADDVTQEAFTKAYLALRGTDKEIQLRPWLYRIVRNTALTDIRDQPKAGIELDEAQAAGMTPEELAGEHEEIRRLMAGLRELPEPQRAAIVMRELEGLSHEQIASSLGLSGGAVRQSIYRARRTLREGIGLLLPMPVLRLLLEEGFAQGAGAAAAGGGAGMAVKTGVAALLAAGTVTTGAVIQHELKATPEAAAKPEKARSADSARDTPLADRESNSGPGHGRDYARDDSGRSGGGRRESDDPSSRRGRDRGGDHSGSGSSGSDGSDGSNSGTGSSGSGTSGSGTSGSGSGSGSLSSGSGSSGSGSSGPGSDGGSGSDLSGRDGGGGSGSGSDDPLK